MTFDELCARPLGAADYIVIASHFHEVFIENVPLLSLELRNEVPMGRHMLPMLGSVPHQLSP